MTLPELANQFVCFCRGHDWREVETGMAANLQATLFGSFTEVCKRCGQTRSVYWLLAHNGSCVLMPITEEKEE